MSLGTIDGSNETGPIFFLFCFLSFPFLFFFRDPVGSSPPVDIFSGGGQPGCISFARLCASHPVTAPCPLPWALGGGERKGESVPLPRNGLISSTSRLGVGPLL